MSDNATHPSHFWDLRSAALVMTLVQIAALRLVFTDWTPFLRVTQTLGFLGVLLGLALGYSAFPPQLVRWVAFAYGMILIPAQLLISVDRTDVLYEDLGVMFLRVLDSLTLLVQNQPVYDALFFIAVVSIGFWNAGLYMGYQLTRHQSFLGVTLPAGIITLVVQVYDAWASLRAWLLAVYIFTALILLGRLYFLQNKNGWKAKHVFFTSDVEGDISRTALVSAAIVIFIAWTFPGMLGSAAPAAKAWSEMTKPIRDRLSDAVSALDSPYRAPTNGDFYGANLRLGSSAPVSDTPVFYVEVESALFKPVRYYWRGRVYDHYLNGQWANSGTMRKDFNPTFDQIQPNNSLTRKESRFTFTLNFPKQELMYAPSEMVWTDRPSHWIAAAPINNSPLDVTAWVASPNLAAGDRYKVRAQIANPSEEELRNAGEKYPQWVTGRYLQIPTETKPQLAELARRIAGDQNTPYDKAQAITLFLRNEIEYATKIAVSPPAGEDPMMWVLFEYKKGFCMYSASAEVLMLRSLGIPARMVVGFAEGEYDSSRNRYVVARLNSHAWPEVYFPNIGWVEFEPTGNQPPLDRPREPIKPAEEDIKPRSISKPLPDDAALDPSPPTLPEKESGSVTLQLILRFLYPVFLLGSLALGIFVMQRHSIVDRLPVYLESRYIESGRQPPNWLTRWSKWATLMPMQRAFHSIDLSLRWLNHSHPACATPLERANILAELLPSAREEIITLKEEHESTLFANRAGSIERARRAGRKILLETMRVRLKKNQSS